MLNEEEVYNARKSAEYFKFEFLKLSKYGDVQALLQMDRVYSLVREEYLNKEDDEAQDEYGAQPATKPVPASLLAFCL